MSNQELLIQAMAELDEQRVIACTRQLMSSGASYDEILSCLNTGIANVGTLFEHGEYFIADLIVSGMIYRSALSLLAPLHAGPSPLPKGRIVIGVVQGDIHDIGKDIISDLLRAERMEVIDLGIDVTPERFAYAVRTYLPDALLMSGVLTSAQRSMRETMLLLQKEGLRSKVPILIGGACASELLMKQIGADGWAHDTNTTIAFCRKVVDAKYAPHA